jgi:hypothetical protein
MYRVSEGHRVSRLVGGVLLLFLGSLFVLQNLGYVSVGHLGDYWPLLLVWVGLTRMLSRRGTVASGFVIFALGVFFQLERLDVIWVPMRLFWPALLIVIGFGLITDAFIARRVGRHALPPQSEAGPGRPS